MKLKVNKKNNILIIICFLLLIVLGISIGYNFFNSNKEFDSHEDSNIIDNNLPDCYGDDACGGVTTTKKKKTTTTTTTTRKTTKTTACVESASISYYFDTSCAANNSTFNVGDSVSCKCYQDVQYRCPENASSSGSYFDSTKTVDTSTAGTKTITCGSGYRAVTRTYNIVSPKQPATLTCSNKTYNGSNQVACSCSGGTVGGTYQATNAGTYTASCSPDSNHTAPTNVTWTIGKATFTCTTSKGNYAYGGTIGNPSISSNPGNGTVTYYRNTSNSTSGGTAWSGTTNTTLAPGTYYMYATIAETTNYKAATCSTGSFTVSACFVNSTTNDYKWQASQPTSSVGTYSINTSLTTSSACTGAKKDVCFVNSAQTEYKWQKEYPGSGFSVNPNKNSEATCKACFKVDANTYVWTDKRTSGTLVQNVETESACQELNVYCYRKKISNEKYDYKWVAQKDSAGYQKVEGITNETDCILEDPDIPNSCLSLIGYMGTNGIMGQCAGTYKLDLGEEKVCSTSIQSQFYTINCKESITTNFKPGNLSVKAGQGFKYNIDVASSNTCAGVFNDTEWNDAYNKAKNLYNRALKTNDEYEKAWYNKIISDLEGFVRDYNNANSNYSNGLVSSGLDNVNGELELEYKVNKKDKTLKYNFIQGNKAAVKVTDNISQAADRETKKLANNVNVSKFNVTIENQVELIPPRVYLDKNGKEVAAGTSGAIDGGNTFLTDLETDKNDPPKTASSYSIDIKLSQLGVSRSGTITNNKCLLTITEGSNDITYRIIDVGNPFGIDAVTPGNNWSNINFNFKATINKNTWSGEYLYKFDLTSQDIKNIKEDNSKWSGLSAYRGVCNENETILSREFKETVCDELNK